MCNMTVFCAYTAGGHSMNLPENHRPADEMIRDSYLSRIIEGIAHSRKDLEEVGAQLGISLPWNAFVSATIHFDDTVFSSNVHSNIVSHVLAEISAVLPEVFEPEHKAYISINARYFSCLINFFQDSAEPNYPEHPEEEALYDIGARMQQIVDRIYDKFGIQLQITLGNVVFGFEHIRYSTEEAKAALAYARMLGIESRIVYFFKYDTPPLNFSTMIQDCLEKRALSCARAGDYEGTLSTLHDVVNELFYKNTPAISLAQCRFGALKSLIIMVLNDIQHDLSDVFWIDNRAVSGIILSDTLSSLMKLTDALFDRIITETAEKRIRNIPPWLLPVKEYINNNYTDDNLNISVLAAHWDLNPAQLSAVFREKFGIGILEYIHSLRLSDAKYLFGQGLNLDSIARQVGYSSSRTMSRAFAKYEGITPGRLNRLAKDPNFSAE